MTPGKGPKSSETLDGRTPGQVKVKTRPVEYGNFLKKHRNLWLWRREKKKLDRFFTVGGCHRHTTEQVSLVIGEKGDTELRSSRIKPEKCRPKILSCQETQNCTDKVDASYLIKQFEHNFHYIQKWYQSEMIQSTVKCEIIIGRT